MDSVASCVSFSNRDRPVVTATRDTDNRSGATLRLDNCQPPVIIKRIYSTVSQNIVFCQRTEFSPEEPKSHCSVLYVRGVPWPTRHHAPQVLPSCIYLLILTIHTTQTIALQTFLTANNSDTSDLIKCHKRFLKYNIKILKIRLVLILFLLVFCCN